MIRIGIVGCGRILAAHLRGYALLRAAGVDDFRITALCARQTADAHMYVRRGSGPAQRQPVGSAPGDPLAVGDIYLSDFQDDVEVAVFSDYRELIESGPVDAINDFTTHVLHHQVGEVAAAAGKHLMTQKPLAVSVAAGRRLCRQFKEAGTVLGVFENARFRPDTRHLRWLFDSQRIGSLRWVQMSNFGNWWAPNQVVAQTPWRHERIQGGGITLDIGVHVFHHLRHVAGEVAKVSGEGLVLEPRRRRADGSEIDCDADDTMLATFHTAAGATGSITASWAGRQPVRIGQGRGFVYEAEQGAVLDEQVKLPDGSNASLAEMYESDCPIDRRQQEFPDGLTDAFALNQGDWLAAIRDQREPETNGGEGLRDLAAAYAILESGAAGRSVTLEEVLSGELRAYQAMVDEAWGLTGD